MIINFENEKTDQLAIKNDIGKEYSAFQKIKNIKFIDNTYNLRRITSKLTSLDTLPKENSKCNFEEFEKGLLLRINDNQELYGITLSKESTNEFILDKGNEKVAKFSLTALLLQFGISKETLKKFYLLSRGFYYGFIELAIITSTEVIILESSGLNYKKEKRFFKRGPLASIFTIK